MWALSSPHKAIAQPHTPVVPAGVICGHNRHLWDKQGALPSTTSRGQRRPTWEPRYDLSIRGNNVIHGSPIPSAWPQKPVSECRF